MTHNALRLQDTLTKSTATIAQYNDLQLLIGTSKLRRVIGDVFAKFLKDLILMFQNGIEAVFHVFCFNFAAGGYSFLIIRRCRRLVSKKLGEY